MRITYLDITVAESGLEPPFSQMSSMENERKKNHILSSMCVLIWLFCVVVHPLYQNARTQQWPQGATLAEKLCGSKQDLIKTTDFISDLSKKSEAKIQGNERRRRRRRRAL